MIIKLNPTGGNFFAGVKTFDFKIAFIGNFVLIEKKLGCANWESQISASSFIFIVNFV